MMYDPMELVDAALAYIAPVIAVRKALMDSGMSSDTADHIAMDYSHYLRDLMTLSLAAQATEELKKSD